MPRRKLEIEIIGDHSSLSRAMRGAVRDSDTLGSRLRGAAATGARALGGLLVGAAAASAYGIAKSTQAAEEANKVHHQTAAVLKSTGHAANITQHDVEGLSGAISRKTGIDDEAVQSGANILLTFKEIRNEAGKGNDIFDQSTQTIVDMSAALDQDLKSSAIQVGKALNDPIKGLTALQRVGVSFSEQKAEQIKQWTEEGHTLRAQKAILRELNSEFGGSAEAQATALEKVKVSFGNVEESVGNVFLPLIDQAATNLNQDLIPELQQTADSLGRIANRKDIDLNEKLGLAGNVIKRDWGQLPGQIGHLMDEAVPIIAEHAGDLGVAWAKGMLHGFIQSDPLGKAAILLFASKAFGGPAGVMGAGKQLGSKFGGAAGTESAAAMAAGFGLSASGGKAFGLIEKTRAIGKTVGTVGLGLGLLEGAQFAIEDPANGLGARLEQLEAQGSGLIGSLERLPGLSQVSGFLADVQGKPAWAEQGDSAHRLLQILEQVNLVHGREHKLLVAEARTLEDQLDLTKEQRREADKTLGAQTTAHQDFKEGIRALESGQITRRPDIEKLLRHNAQAIETFTAQGTQGAREAAAKNFRAVAHAIEVGMDRGVISTKRGTAEIRQLLRQAHLVTGDDPWGIARGFARSWEKAGKITDQSLDQITRGLGKMPPAAAQVTGQMMLQIARQMRQKGELSKTEVERLRSAVVTKLGLMASQGGKKGEAFEGKVGGAFGGLSIVVMEALENMGANVQEVMSHLGAADIPKWQLQVLRGWAGGKVGSGAGYAKQLPVLPKHAQGGPVRVPGQGLQDTVPLLVNNALAARVAPGEVLTTFNRHQLPLVDRALANEFGVGGLRGFFETFDKPHYMARGGVVEPHIGGPDPLRSLGQAGIHKAFTAAVAYVNQHRPQGGIGGPAPPGFDALYRMWQPNHPQWDVWQTGLLMQKMGFDVAENPHFGGVHPVHTSGSWHYQGRAFDFNWPAGGATELAHLNAVIPGLARLHPKDPLLEDAGTANQHGHFAFGQGGLLAMARGGVLEVKGQPATAAQEKVAAEIMRAAGETGANHLARVAALMAAIQESELGAASSNTFQLTGAKSGTSPTASAYDQALAWFKVGFYGKGGGIQLSHELSNPTEIAQAVEGSAYPTAYAPWKHEAQSFVDTLGKDTEPPASTKQKRTLGTLRHRAERIVREAQKLKSEYSRYGGTKRGRQNLKRTLQLAKEAAEKAAAGDREAAKRLIDKARSEIGKANDSFEKAQEGVYTPGLKPGHLPALGASSFDPGQDFSLTNLPGLSDLSPEVLKALKSPGLNWAGKYGVLETALTSAGLTDTKADDAAALNAMLGMDRAKRQHLKKQLAELNRRLAKGGLTKKQRATLVSRRDQVLQGLSEVGGHVGSIREQVGGLNEEGEGAGEDPAVKAAEEAKQAAEDMAAAARELKASVDQQNKIAESELAVGKAELTRAIADLISGELGPRTAHQSQTAGAGSVGTY